MSLDAFVWSDHFATGIGIVDAQHQELFKIINQIGNMLVKGDAVSSGESEAMIKSLADYARFHFADEERVMAEGGLDPGYIDSHKELHRRFTQQVITLWQGRASMTDPVQTLYGFLSSWLVYHILGDDQKMARAITRVRGGMTHAEAHKIEIEHAEISNSALLQALHNLYGVVSQQNLDLARANVDLESRVEARSKELSEAYARLSTEHKALVETLAKVEQTQSQLMQSEKMASIGQLAAGVAHEINNPIGFVTSNLGTLGRYANDLLRLIDAAQGDPHAQTVAKEIDLPFLREDIAALLAESRDGLERVRRIVANLKEFSHVDEAAWQQADLLSGLESTINVVWHELKFKTAIVRELQPLPLVRCLPAQINQVFMALLLNAVHAIPEHGVITLRSGHDAKQVWIELADTGSGMTEEVKRRLFEPFFTTKPVGQGAGLGLSMAYDIVSKHGGRFEVESSQGRGSRIRFWLPMDGKTTPASGDSPTKFDLEGV